MFKFFQPPRLEALVAANTPPVLYPLGKDGRKKQQEEGLIEQKGNEGNTASWEGTTIAL